MISWSSEPELLYRETERENKLVPWKEAGLNLNYKVYMTAWHEEEEEETLRKTVQALIEAEPLSVFAVILAGEMYGKVTHV